MDRRIERLEQEIGMGIAAAELTAMQRQVTAILTGAPLTVAPVPSPAAIAASLRFGVPIVHGEYVIVQRGGQLFVRRYNGVDLAAV